MGACPDKYRFRNPETLRSCHPYERYAQSFAGGAILPHPDHRGSALGFVGLETVPTPDPRNALGLGFSTYSPYSRHPRRFNTLVRPASGFLRPELSNHANAFFWITVSPRGPLLQPNRIIAAVLCGSSVRHRGLVGTAVSNSFSIIKWDRELDGDWGRYFDSG